MDNPRVEVTRLLQQWSVGRQDALEELLPAIYDELRRLATAYLRRERPDHTLQATALVHEAFLKLVDQRSVQWQNRAHFFAVAAQCMRRILVDAARARQSLKRGGDQARVELDPELTIAAAPNIDLVALDEALNGLAAVDERRSRVVELRFFGGLTVEETAGVLDVSPETIMRDWKVARAWLFKQLNPAPPAP